MKTTFVITNNLFNTKNGIEIKETKIFLKTIPEVFLAFAPMKGQKPPPGWVAKECSLGLN